MNVWMKRGLQTALLTGGLLALGTGVAAADDSTLGVSVEVGDGSVSGTNGGGSVVDADAPVTVCGTAVAVLGDATAGCGAPAGGGSGTGSSDGGGSRIDADAPVTVSSTAVGLLGDATAGSGAPAGGGSGTGGSDGENSDSGGSDSGGSDSGGSATGGPVVDADTPVTVSGTAVGVLGDAAAGSGAPDGPTEPGTCAGSAHPATAQHADGRAQLPTAGPQITAGGPAPWADTLVRPARELAYTGSNTVFPLLVGLFLLIAGTALGLAGRGRPAGTARDVEETGVFLTRRVPRPGRRG